MDALLGKITGVESLGSGEQTGERLAVCFTPVCVLPAHTAAPAWLDGQELSVIREAPDPREVGHAGDSLVLTPEESARWLHPLQVAPELVRGEMPDTLHVSLHWWKDDAPPPLIVAAAGRQVRGDWRREGDRYVADIATAPLFDAYPPTTAMLQVRCGPFTTGCAVLARGLPTVLKLPSPLGEIYHLENAWYALEIPTALAGGGLLSLREQAREVEHFSPPAAIIQAPFANAGHADRYATEWRPSPKMATTAMTTAGARQESTGTRLFLEGVADAEAHLRTSLTCLLHDHLPLISWQRTFQYDAAKPTPHADAPGTPVAMPIDDIRTLRLGFRTAWMADADSRILCGYDDHLAIFRPALVNDEERAKDWWMTGGWALIEHPSRRQCLLYLFDPIFPPLFAAKREAHALVLKPWWPAAPARPGEAFSLTLALSAGELCGATALGGAWVACRSVGSALGVHGAVIARLRELSPDHTARMTLGTASCEVPLQAMSLPGAGVLHYAVATFPEGRLEEPFDAMVAGMPSRWGGTR